MAALYRLALCNIRGYSFRSWVVGLCALLISGLVLATSLILLGAESSLRLAIDRLGADIIVVPEGAATRVETALLMGRPTKVWMPASALDTVAAIPGVEAVSPQVYLASLTNASCCTVSDMFLIVFDPKTDFVVKPWLEKTIGGNLQLGDVIGGSSVYVPEEGIKLYGYYLNLRKNLAPTGTGLDQSLFMTMDTAQEMRRVSLTEAVQPLEIPTNSISAVLVKLKPGANVYAVALEISDRDRTITPIVSPDMFQSYQGQLKGLLGGVLVMIVIILAFSMLLIGLVFSMAANERRRELGVLRAMGASRGFVFRSLVMEAALLAINGGIAGVLLTFLILTLFRNLIISILGMPFLLPSLPVLILLVVGVICLSLVIVVLAASLPAYRISHLDPSIAMRE
ncbi:MAG: FtsX-like permease family protein [Chloroflexi bacterium]|nr:FtsX-like permease family protein [Chloroflexota bacterium]